MPLREFSPDELPVPLLSPPTGASAGHWPMLRGPVWDCVNPRGINGQVIAREAWEWRHGEGRALSLRSSPSFDDLPRGHFGTILADPPWAFRTFSGENMTPHRCAEDHYRTMELAEMKALPIGDIAAKDCALFMWVVGSHLAESIELASSWGFEFKTDAFYWLKQRLHGADQIGLFTNDLPEPRMGFGYWTRKQIEPCWLFTRGSPKRLTKGVRQAIIEPRREHSRKPDEQYRRIEALVGGPYLEMFARNERPGWTAWGNQIDKFAGVA